MASAYSELLRDPRWQRKRLEILQRDDFTCRACEDGSRTLHVHHKYYRPGAKPWEYDNKVLVTLCENCHTQETDELKDYQPLLLRSLAEAGFLADQYREIAFGFSCLELQHAPEVVASAIACALANPEIQNRLIDLMFETRPDFFKRKQEMFNRLCGERHAE